MLLGGLAVPPALSAGTIRGRLLTSPISLHATVTQGVAEASVSKHPPRAGPPGDASKRVVGTRVTPGAQTPAGSELLVPQRRVKEAVVYVDRIPDKVERKLTRGHWWKREPKLPRIVQANRRFTPRVLAVAAGSRVEFANLDRVYHNAFSVSAARRFDLGKYLPGHVDTVAFDRAGVANLHCDIHPDESGFVVVLPNHAFTRPDSLGRFTLPKLPPGTYSVRAWHPRLGELRREVTMLRRGDLTLELKY